jgi:hypothetical protein
MDEVERLKFCIERSDHYYDSINNKSAVFLAIGTFVVGGLVASYPYLKENLECLKLFHILLPITLLLGLVALILVLFAAIPFVEKGSKSLYYFNSVAFSNLKDFQQDSEDQTEIENLKDLRSQVFFLFKGLRKKFLYIKIAGILYILMFISLAFLIAFIMLNLK